MDRRHFSKIVVIGAAGIATVPGKKIFSVGNKSIRLGGPVFRKVIDPDEWIKALIEYGYRAAYCPVQPGDSPDLVKLYEKAASKADIIIAEVGAWSNPIDPDSSKSKAAIEKCMRSLELAEMIGARCCVNISGSRNPDQWAGPHKNNLIPETFDLIVETTRKIIDAVKPVRSFYSLETMPWAYPDSTDSYLRLIKSIDRKSFAVHFDPVNLVNSPYLYYNNGILIREFFKRLGSHIKSCHAKDISLLEDQLTPQFVEVRPGLGNLDYVSFLTELSNFPESPLMMEHLKREEDYQQAASHIRQMGKMADVIL